MKEVRGYRKKVVGIDDKVIMGMGVIPFMVYAQRNIENYRKILLKERTGYGKITIKQ